jgi:GntR family transcriptional regulator, transcriptional repressor for pyruvate dehydrogenase complex
VSLPARIATELRAQIAEGALRPGDQLPGHRALAARFGVSLGVAREAISILIGDGQLETVHGRGTFVAQGGRTREPEPMTLREVTELVEARELLGLNMVVMAAERAGGDDFARLRRAVGRMEEDVADASRYPEAEALFHVTLAEAAGNRFLVDPVHDFYVRLRGDIELATAAAIERFGDLRFSVDEHRELVEQIEDGRTDAARETLTTIMSRHHEFLLGLYGLGPTGGNGA